MILDSGERRTFSDGAVRDIVEGKGRCDLLPLDIIAKLISDQEHGDHPYSVSKILKNINQYIQYGHTTHLELAITYFVGLAYSGNMYTAILEVAKHYEEGCNKYGERNWEKGIPIHCYLDSAVRHLLKWLRGDDDEPHDRAFIWNMLGAIWTHTHLPKYIDTPAAQNTENE